MEILWKNTYIFNCFKSRFIFIVLFFAWTQEAYRPRCSECSFCCPNWVPPPTCPDLSGGVPCWGGYPTLVPPPRLDLAGYPPPSQTWQGTPPGRVPPRLNLAGYPPAGYPPRLDLAGYPPPARPGRVPPPPRCLPHGILGNVAKYYGIWVPPLGVEWQTKWNYYLPVVLRTRAVKIAQKSFMSKML